VRCEVGCVREPIGDQLSDRSAVRSDAWPRRSARTVYRRECVRDTLQDIDPVNVCLLLMYCTCTALHLHLHGVLLYCTHSTDENMSRKIRGPCEILYSSVRNGPGAALYAITTADECSCGRTVMYCTVNRLYCAARYCTCFRMSRTTVLYYCTIMYCSGILYVSYTWKLNDKQAGKNLRAAQGYPGHLGLLSNPSLPEREEDEDSSASLPKSSPLETAARCSTNAAQCGHLCPGTGPWHPPVPP
jgi:hypothetical protein